MLAHLRITFANGAREKLMQRCCRGRRRCCYMCMSTIWWPCTINIFFPIMHWFPFCMKREREKTTLTFLREREGEGDIYFSYAIISARALSPSSGETSLTAVTCWCDVTFTVVTAHTSRYAPQAVTLRHVMPQGNCRRRALTAFPFMGARVSARAEDGVSSGGRPGCPLSHLALIKYGQAGERKARLGSIRPPVHKGGEGQMRPSSATAHRHDLPLGRSHADVQSLPAFAGNPTDDWLHRIFRRRRGAIVIMALGRMSANAE